MADQWLDFISTLSLQAPASTACENAICPAINQGFLQIAGPDAAKFLQGQLSCDVNAVSLQQSALGTHSTPKGRMLSSFRIIQNDENSYLLNLHPSITDSAKAALAKYIVFSKAEINENTALNSFALHGDAARAALQNIVGNLPEADYQQQIDGSRIIICSNAASNSYLVIDNNENLTALFQQLFEQLPACTAEQDLLWQHQQGLAFVEAATQDEFIPQMFNYQKTPAISFQKGCYTGQEIIARMKYLGKLKRHMYRYQCQSDTELRAGDKIFMEGKAQSIGDIVSSINLGEQQWDLLMVLTDEGAAAPSLKTEAGELQQQQKLELPYSIEE